MLAQPLDPGGKFGQLRGRKPPGPLRHRPVHQPGAPLGVGAVHPIAQRLAIQASDAPASVLAERFCTTAQTVYKWRHRDSVNDRSHTAHRLQTTLTPAQEAVAVVLRKTLLVSIDDLLALTIGLEPMMPAMARCGSS